MMERERYSREEGVGGYHINNFKFHPLRERNERDKKKKKGERRGDEEGKKRNKRQVFLSCDAS